MQAKSEYRDRPKPEVSVLDALVERSGEGMTVLELRAAVDEDIDTIEQALADLKSDDLIVVEHNRERMVITPADEVIPDPGEVPDDDLSLLEAIRGRLGL